MFEQIKEIIAETVSVDPEKITLGAKLSDDLGIDSLDAVDVSMAIEEAFSMAIAEEALGEFVTVEDIVKYVEANK